MKDLRNQIIKFQDEESNVERFEEWLSRKQGRYGNNGKILFDAYVVLDLEKCSIDMESELDAEGVFPVWISFINSHGRSFRLSLNAGQAKQIKEGLEKFLAAEEAFSRTKRNCLQERTA